MEGMEVKAETRAPPNDVTASDHFGFSSDHLSGKGAAATRVNAWRSAQQPPDTETQVTHCPHPFSLADELRRPQPVRRSPIRLATPVESGRLTQPVPPGSRRGV